MDNPKKSYWVKTQIQGLYERRTTALPKTVRGVFYSRYRLNGKQTFRSLDTDVYEHAKIKHAARNVTVEKDRQRGNTSSGDFRTLGALLAEIEHRMAADNTTQRTKDYHACTIQRLRTQWQQGAFNTFLARNCTAEVIGKFRDYLSQKARWTRGSGRALREHFGLSRSTVNQTLWVLSVMLDVAKEHAVIAENPFSVPTVLRESLFVGPNKTPGGDGPKGGGRIKNIPSRPDMARILAEVRRGPGTGPAERRPFLSACASHAADHVELMACSGMRKAEAAASLIGDDRGDKFLIRGTKSAKSWRAIPVNPALRVVLDRIKSRRIGEKTKLVTASSPRAVLFRACGALGLPRVRVHDLRHFFASVCISSGVPVATVAEWLGHSDGGALCMKTYSHLLEDHSQAAAQKVDFSGALQAAG